MSRYDRQVTLPELGEQGQRRLAQGSVLIVGAGGLGSPAAIYLAAAGVGRIGLVDFDEVDETNLHRQVLYGTRDVGRPKLEAAAARLHDLNPEVTVVTHAGALTSDNALEIATPYDVIIDGTDNFPTRYLVGDVCTILHKPNVYGSVFRFDGQVAVFDADRGPCYRCLYPEPPPPGLVPSCAVGGVLGVLPGIVGTIQATEAIKLLTGIGEPLLGRLLLIDALHMHFREVRLPAQHGQHERITHLIDYEGFCNPAMELELTPQQLVERLSEVVLIDVREPHEFAAGHIDGARNLPLGRVPHELESIPSDCDVVLYCAMGGRSGRALEILRGAGYVRAAHLKGGYMAWSRRGIS
jgi:molybdopterin/thiamine biosynthesis adenylyltransferase/rhodanese-related sulfurtransferase